MNSVTLSSLSRRMSFSGKTDYYGERFLSQLPTLHMQLALEGKGPADVTQDYFNENSRQSAIERLNRYRASWQFYRGDHWANPIEDGEIKPVLNFCKKIVDAGVDWFVAKGWKTVAPSGNEGLAEIADLCWEANNRLVLTERAAQYGAICGDAFFYVTLNEEAEDMEAKVEINVLDPAHSFPLFDSKTGKLSAYLYQYPIQDENGATVLYSLIINSKEWRAYIGDKLSDSGPNKFGEVNVIHVPNFTLADSVFGQNDIHQVMPLNEEYNTVLNSIRRVLKYHAEPTTLIFGVKAGDMERGAKKVWSNLPSDARVENLQLQSDLEASNTYLDRLERMMGELSNTPRAMFDSKDLHLSNASGLVMQMMYQPIIDKTRKRQCNYRKGFKAVNRLILKGFELLGVNLEQYADTFDTPADRYGTDIEFTSPLPRDEQAELDVALKKIEAKIWSRAEGIRRIANVADSRRLILELAADERHDLAIKLEEQKAASGVPVNLMAPFLGSAFLSEDFDKVMEASSEQEKETADTEQAKAKAMMQASAAPAP